MKTCSVEGCSSPVRCKQLCGKHYGRLQKNGNVERIARQCALCEADFIPRGRAKWCDDCKPSGARLYCRQWYRDNKVHALEYAKDYAQRPATRDNRQRWMDDNRASVRQWSQRRRARLRGNGIFQVTQRDLHRLMRVNGFGCAYCGKALTDDNLTWDHMVPIARGGCHSVGNLTPACKPCNSGKRDSTVMEWRMFQIRLSKKAAA